MARRAMWTQVWKHRWPDAAKLRQCAHQARDVPLRHLEQPGSAHPADIPVEEPGAEPAAGRHLRELAKADAGDVQRLLARPGVVEEQRDFRARPVEYGVAKGRRARGGE